MPTLANKTLFISGASRGIGLAIALRAARDGANVALIAKTAEPHPKLAGTVYTAAEQIEAAGGQALPIVGDIRDEDAGRGRRRRRRSSASAGSTSASTTRRAINLAGTEALEMKRYDLMQDINTRGTFVVSARLHPAPARRPRTRTSSRSRRRSSLEPEWLGPHIGYTLAKYGMSLLALGLRRGARARTGSPPTRCGRAR